VDKNALFLQFVAFSASVHQLTDELTKDVRSEAVTQAQYKILEYVAIKQPLTLSEISSCMHMSLPNTSRELRKLTEKRLCQKITDPEDRRKQLFRLTESGEAMMGEAFQRIQARFLALIEEVDDKELEELGQALQVLQNKVFR
jgi:DNA-binding MarR family transcriptional regulator